MANKTIQKQQVLDYIKANGSIDGWTARIWDLKADGVPIKKTIRYSEDGSTHWAEYSLIS